VRLVACPDDVTDDVANDVADDMSDDVTGGAACLARRKASWRGMSGVRSYPAAAVPITSTRE